MIILAALVLAQAPATVPGKPVPASVQSQLPTAKVECRMVMEAGSRIPFRVCRLDKEWELLAKDAQDDIRSSRNGRGVADSSGDPR